MPHSENAVLDRRENMAAFEKEVRSDIADMRMMVEKAHAAAQKAHDETISSRASVNANSEHMIKMCDLVTVQYGQIAKGMAENAATSKKALELAEKTAKDTAGIVKFYNIGDSAVSVVARVPGKVSKFSKAAYPVIAVVALGAALWDKGLSGAAKILEVFR